MWLRLRCMLIKEFHQMLRDVRMRLVVFAFPVIQMTVLAFALTTDVKDIRTAVLDMDNTPASRAVTAAFESGGWFEVRKILKSPGDIHRVLDSSEVQAVIHIPRGFEGDLNAGRSPKLQVVADGTYNNDTAIIFNYAQQVLNTFNPRWVADAPALPVNLAVRAWYNPNLLSKFYFVPGLICVMLAVISLLLTSIAIVREKEIGTIEQVMVTPIRRTEFIAGKTLPFLITGLITMTNMLIVARPVFGLRVHGSLILLYAVAVLFLVGNLGIALLISVTAHTQQQALLTAFLVLMPSVLLSGFIFPIHNMPSVIQLLTYLNPMRWFLQIMHGIAIRGVGLGALWPAIGAQAILAGGAVTLAVLRFRKTMA
ncbi:MAG: ABC transporter permease [Desulfobacteraceae bacterium]